MLRAPHLLALLVPAALLAGALGFQHLGGLPPCEMCMWQRWPLLAAIAFGLAAITGGTRVFLALAGLAILGSGAVGLFHAGVEQRWWEGITGCASTVAVGGSAEDFLKGVMAKPLVRCDAIPWSWLGVSLAGWNAIISSAVGAAILWLTLKR
jgi:disulfide bond formation protein DsbB